MWCHGNNNSSPSGLTDALCKAHSGTGVASQGREVAAVGFGWPLPRAQKIPQVSVAWVQMQQAVISGQAMQLPLVEVDPSELGMQHPSTLAVSVAPTSKLLENDGAVTGCESENGGKA